MGELGSALLKIARKTIEDSFTGTLHFDKGTLLWLYPALTAKQATFVTLNLDNRLRGCIGTLSPRRALLDDLVANSFSAAFKDKRFKPLTKAEASMISIEVSLLSPPKEVEFDSKEELLKKIEPEKDGIVLECEGKRATYLPHVWQQIPKFDDFFIKLAEKAGVEGDIFTKDFKVYSYRVKSFSEEESGK